MARFGISIRTAVVATFFVMLLGLNAALAQSNGDINTKKNSTNFQTIMYGTPKQTTTSNQPNKNVYSNTRTANVILPKHVQVTAPLKTSSTPSAQPEKCALCPKGASPTTTGCGCTVPQPTCQPCGGYRRVNEAEPADPMMCDTMCAY